MYTPTSTRISILGNCVMMQSKMLSKNIHFFEQNTLSVDANLWYNTFILAWFCTVRYIPHRNILTFLLQSSKRGKMWDTFWLVSMIGAISDSEVKIILRRILYQQKPIRNYPRSGLIDNCGSRIVYQRWRWIEFSLF